MSKKNVKQVWDVEDFEIFVPQGTKLNGHLMMKLSFDSFFDFTDNIMYDDDIFEYYADEDENGESIFPVRVVKKVEMNIVD